MPRALRAALPAALLLALFASTGCDSPQAVSKFCAASIATLAGAQPVFDDLKASCLREIDTRRDFAVFQPPTESDPNCDLIGKQAEGAEAAAQTVSDYFTAVNALATFGTTKAGTDAQALATKGGAAFSASSDAQAALGSLAQFVASAATAGYRERQLENDIPAASASIGKVVEGLTKILRDNYIHGLLGEEEKKLAVRYKAAASGATLAEKLSLEALWTAEENALVAKRAAAEKLIAALECIASGMKQLADNAHRIRAKELESILAPYAAQLQTLAPQIQKAF